MVFLCRLEPFHVRVMPSALDSPAQLRESTLEHRCLSRDYESLTLCSYELSSHLVFPPFI